MKRSQNVPLTLTWWTPPPHFFATFEAAPSKSYFVTHANSILPRLRSLNVNTTCFNFTSLHRVIENSKPPPLQLRNLTVIKRHSFREKAPPLEHLIDSSCLRYIKLCEVDLPWLALPHNKLTHFTFKNPVNPPVFSQLLAFLSNRTCLEVLEVGFQDDFVAVKITFPPMTPTSRRAPTRLDLPNLTKLKLGAFGMFGSISYDYIVRFALCIRTRRALSWFNLTYEPGQHVPDLVQHDKPFHIFGAVPQEVFSHLSKYQYLAIDLKDEEGRLKICGHTYVSDQHGSSDLPKHQFFFNSAGLGLSNDYSAVLELIYAIPQIRHLTVGGTTRSH